MLDSLNSFQKADPEDLGSVLEGELNSAEKALRDFFLVMIGQLTSAAAVEDILRFLETGSIGEAIERAALAGSALAAKVNEAYVSAGQATAGFINNQVEVIVSFDQVNERAVLALRENNFRFIQQISHDVRTAIQSSLVDQTIQGLNPREQATQIQRFIGLTEKQSQMVRNYRNNLETLSARSLTRDLRDRRFDSVIRRAIKDQTPLTDEQIARMVDRYRSRFIAYRARVIARTEALRAVHQGSDEMIRQALSGGVFEDQDIVRQWITAGDERVRGTHKTMHGQKRSLDEPFRSGAGVALRYPGDIAAPPNETLQCRCVVTTRIRSL